MGKTKTSKKRGGFSIDDVPISKVKGKTYRHDPTKELANAKKIALALAECILDGDEEAFNEILAAHLEAVDKTALAGKTGLSRQTIYKAMKGNPTIKTVMHIVQGLKAS